MIDSPRSIVDYYDIFVHFCTQSEFTYDEPTGKKVANVLNTLYETRKENFANARTVRNLFERCVANHANRLATQAAPNAEDLTTLTQGDISEDVANVDSTA